MHPGQSSARLQGAFLLHRQRYVVVFLSAMMAIMALLATPEAQAQSPAPTTTTLALSDSSGLLSSGSSVTAGTVVTFTATVINTSPVTTGLVTFCDFATATYCDNSALIGTAQLTSAGTAIISLVPGMGNHSYVAVFNGTPYGTPANAASTSLLQALTVTGYRTTTLISASGSAGSYTLTGTVVGWGNSNVGPTGSVSFMDATNSDYVLGMATLGTATFAGPFTVMANFPPAIPTGTEVYGVAVGDFNGDGIPDLAVANLDTNYVSVLLGNGDGTFQTPVTYNTGTGSGPISVAVGDFNGDGLPDLAVANYTAGTVTVLLGTGNGTFCDASNTDGYCTNSTLGINKANTYTVGSEPRSVAVGDFNGDGLPDLVVANYGGSISVLLNVAPDPGTFTPAPNCTTTCTYGTFSEPRSVAVGDFNGDGLPDLAVANYGNGTVSVLLNNPSDPGTFTATPNSPYTGGTSASTEFSSPTYVAVGDFNGDGLPDLVVTNAGSYSGSYNVTVMLNIYSGSGSDPFASSSTSTFPMYTTGSASSASEPWGVAIGDFNGDGFADLAVANFGGSTVSVLLNDADDPGTFAAASYSPITVGSGSSTPVRVAVGDFNGDGLADLAVTNYGNNMVEVLLSGVTQTAKAISAVAVPGSGGSDSVDAGYPGDSNFAPSTSPPASLTSSTTALSITGSGSMTYGGAASYTPLYTYYNGTANVVNSPTAPAFVTALPTCTTIVPTSSSVGTYPMTVTCSGAVAGSYAISYVAGTMTVNQAPLSITASSGTMTYGGTPPTVTPSYSAFAGNDTVASLTTAPTCTTTASSSTPAGTDTGANTCSGAVDPNYSFTYVAGNVTVGTAPLSITASSGTMTYGGTPPTVTPSYTGFVNGDTAPSLTTAPTCTTTASSSTPAGTDTGANTCSGAVDPNYSFTYVAGNVTVGTAPLSITASSGTMTYGGTPPTVTPSYSGFVNGNTGASLTTAPTCATAATSSTPAGTDTGADTCAGAVDTNYTISYVPGNVTVGTVPLSITASSGTMTYGGTPPTVTPSYSGFVNGDTAASLTAAPTCTTAATSSTPVGTDTGADTCAGAVDPNYTISYVPGNVTVSTASLTITASSATMTYGGTPPTVAPLYTYGAVVNSSTPPSGMTTLPICTTSASSSTPAGTDTGADTCTGAVDPNYTISYAAGNATVNKATPVITWATPAAITYGTALSSTQLDATASVAGTFVYSPAAGTTPAAGTDTLSATFTPNDATDYNTATASVTLAVADFTFGASSGSSTTATVAPGSSATYTLSVGSEGGFNQSVTFTCAGAPSEATCTVSPSPAAAGTKVTVTVTTTAPSLSAPRSRPLPPAPPLSTGLRNLLLLSLVLAAMAWAFSRRKQIGTRRWKGAFLPLAAGMLLALALAGCGGGGGSVTPPPNGGTPAGTYPLTVTGSTGSGSSALSHSVTLTLTVS